MTFSKAVQIDASPRQVWQVMSDLVSWPDWTPTISKIQIAGDTPIGVGTKVKIEQPKLPPAVYKITSWSESEGFVMVKGNLFLKVSLIHRLAPTLQGTTAELTVLFSGLFASWVAKHYGSLMSEYLSLEACGLKKQSEAFYLSFRHSEKPGGYLC